MKVKYAAFHLPLTDTEAEVLEDVLASALRVYYKGDTEEAEKIDVSTMQASAFGLPVGRVQSIQGVLRKLKNRNLYSNNAKEQKESE